MKVRSGRFYPSDRSRTELVLPDTVFKLLYGGTPEIVLKISRIGAANSQVLHLELTDLPDRPEAALRFRIQAIRKTEQK